MIDLRATTFRKLIERTMGGIMGTEISGQGEVPTYWVRGCIQGYYRYINTVTLPIN